MAILPSTISKPVIDLSTNEGNTFFLIAQVVRLGKTLGVDVKQTVADMTSGDYMNALYVFDKAMGSYIDLRLPECMSLDNIQEQKKAKDGAFTLSNIVDSLN